MDPIALRRINDTTREPINGKPYTSRSLMACFDEGAKAFGWAQRSAPPKSMSDGDWLIGYGCATTCYPTQMAPAAARVRLQRDGGTRVEIAGHEIGNGAYTVIGQAAAEKLGVPVDKVSVFIGDSDLPPAPVAGGSNSTASTCSAVMMVCDQIRQRLFKALMPDESLVDKAKETVGIGQTASARTARSDRPLDLAQAFDALGVSVVEEYGGWKPDGAPLDSLRAMHRGEMRMVGGSGMKDKIAYAFGAEFVEVRINRWTHEIRVPRLLGAFAAGHIMNPRTARSQLMGGLIWGMSSALLEATELDDRYARYVNDNLADYLVPVNADCRASRSSCWLSRTTTSIRPASRVSANWAMSAPMRRSAMRSSTPPASGFASCRCGWSSSKSRRRALLYFQPGRSCPSGRANPIT
jgi:xanthine dehydrogenase YagR molybdenum-binding subunit